MSLQEKGDRMTFYTYVFSVVVYRNYKDLIELLYSLEKHVKASYRVIVVNNFYDEASESEIKKISAKYNCDFISAPNKGYGAGNNTAIDYALKHYTFNYLIVSNPDVVLKKFDDENLQEIGDVIAPEIITPALKKQNPMAVFDMKSANWLIYKGLKHNNKLFFVTGISIHKLVRIIASVIYSFTVSKKHRIYMVHGSFFLLSYQALKKLNPLYDEKMFLFAEENYLAIRFKRNEIKSWYTDRIQVLHKEDGSMQFRNDINEQLRTSNIYVYEKYYKRGIK